MIYDLQDFTFIVPIFIDSDDRINNLRYTLKRLFSRYNSKILIAEYSPDSRFYKEKNNLIEFSKNKNFNYLFINSPDEIFHKTKLINTAIKKIETPYFILHDTDTLILDFDITYSATHIRNGIDFVYPYNGLLLNVTNFDYEYDLYDNNILKFPCEIYDETSYECCLLGNKEKFIQAGMMNQKLISWGFNNTELYYRLVNLGYSIIRSHGACYHLNHFRTFNSSSSNPYFKNNYQEYFRMLNLNEEKINKEILGWKWKTD